MASCSRKRRCRSDGTMGDAAPDWSSLHGDLVKAVARKITAIEDYVRFRAVCKPWRTAAPARPRHLPTQLPWLMLPKLEGPDGSEDMAFFSIAKRGLHRLPGAGSPFLPGSSHGWLVMVGETRSEMSLLNPITGATLPLPPVSTLPNFLIGNPQGIFFRKVVLSSEPAADRDVVVMAVTYTWGVLVFCRLGDISWRWMKRGETPLGVDRIDDVAYHKGHFYCVFTRGMVALCDLGPPASFKLMEVSAPIAHDDPSSDDSNQGVIDFVQLHLVESTDGKLLLVSHYQFQDLCCPSSTMPSTVRFEVFKLELDGLPKISKLASIGDNALFVCWDHLVAVSAARFPGKIQGNCAYSADSYYVSLDGEDPVMSVGVNIVDTNPNGLRWHHDVLVFNLANGNKNLSHRLYGSGPVQPMWFTPSLCQ